MSQNLGTAGVILSCTGISSTLGILYILQLHAGINLLLHPRNPSPVHFEALLPIIFFIVAIARAWHMIGARDTGLAAVVGGLVRERHQTTQTPANVLVTSTTQANSTRLNRDHRGDPQQTRRSTLDHSPPSTRQPAPR